jgi:murein DD-endopeptidase MepM/ murein hydrolase activator NlpD
LLVRDCASGLAVKRNRRAKAFSWAVGGHLAAGRRGEGLLRNALTQITAQIAQLRQFRGATQRVLRSPDARWALVSTALTTSVAVTVTCLSLAATPSSSTRAYEPRRETAGLPVDMLLRMAGLHAIPALPSTGTSELYRSAGLIGPGITGPLERLLKLQHGAGKPQIETRMLTAEKGESIVGMLEGAGVSRVDAAAIVDAIKPVYSPKKIRLGQQFKAVFGPATAAGTVDGAAPDQTAGQIPDGDNSDRRLLSLSFAPTIDHLVNVHLTAPDNYFAENIQRKLEERYEHAGANIDSSLYQAAVQAGIGPTVVVEIIRMFSYEVDFQRDIHPGDSFEVFFSNYVTEDGQPAKRGDILAASLTLGDKTHLLYRFETANGEVEYFNPKGESAKSMLMKTPVDGARISSGFGARLHPILGYTRMHKGIDFAVPSGTPVMAAGSGKMTFRGWAGEYGNMVVLDHGNGYSTAYAHLSRFAEDAHVGDHISQGEVVAFSGMTGLATGPHLHYEIRIHNNQVNPATVKVASGRKLEGDDLAAFLAERNRLETLEASLPIEHKLAQAASDRQVDVQ